MYSAIALLILRPNVVQSKVTPSLSLPDGSLTTTSRALEYQVGHAVATVSLAQMFPELRARWRSHGGPDTAGGYAR
jgi:hypothetical protein